MGRNIPWYKLPAKIFHKLMDILKNKILDIVSFQSLRRTYAIKKRRHCKNTIKVFFISQMPEVWDKQAGVFENMIEDKRFSVRILCVPKYDFVRKCLTNDDEDNFNFLKNRYGEKFIIRYLEHPDYIKKADYVFYDRPYNHYLPKKLDCKEVSRTSDVCMINYCTYDWDRKFIYKDFARYTSLWFCSNQIEYKRIKEAFANTKYRKSFNIGYPAFQYYTNTKRTNEMKNIIWTPRWSYDEGVGGSHFLEYIDDIIRFAEDNRSINITIRPHPLMFDNFISQKILSIDEKEKIIERCNNVGIKFDDNKVIRDTFDDSDILISDYSSVISLFYVSGKPIIYCPTDVSVTEDFKKIEKSLYVAYDWDSIEKCLESLIKGNDLKEEERKEINKKYFYYSKNCIGKIINKIIEDYKTK